VTNEAQQFDVVVIGGGPGGYAAPCTELPRGSTWPSSSATRSVGPACTAVAFRQGVLGDRARSSHGRTLGGVRHHDKGTTVDFAVSQNRKNEIVDRLFKGLSGLLKGRKVTIFAAPVVSKPTVRHRGRRRRRGVIAKGANVILAAARYAHPPGFDVDGTIV